MKILYAAANSLSSRTQLQRWLEYQSDQHTIKVAAYKKSSPANVNIDWTLDCLLNLFNPSLISFNSNENLAIYLDAVRAFAPDLIISDLEIFTSSIAMELGIPLWQYSSKLLRFGLTRRYLYDQRLFSSYSYVFNRDPLLNQKLNNIIINSDRNYVCSHLGNLIDPPDLKDNFEWSKPYYGKSKPSQLCHHNMVVAYYDQSKKLFEMIKGYEDSVVFSEHRFCAAPCGFSKDIAESKEYYCNLYNSDIFLCESEAGFLADAFYNMKKPIIDINYRDSESILNGLAAIKFDLAYDINDFTHGVNLDLDYQLAEVETNNDIQFIHEKMDQVIY